RGPAFIRGSLLNLLRRPVTRLVRKIREISGPEKRLAAEAGWGAFRRRAMDGGGAISVRLTCAAQVLGLSFALGILVFSAVDCLFYSRVFGWQSTTTALTTEAAHNIVRVMAAPWSWAAPAGT